jgi:hypothetical protein
MQLLHRANDRQIPAPLLPYVEYYDFFECADVHDFLVCQSKISDMHSAASRQPADRCRR